MAASPLPHPAAVHADQAGHHLPGSAQRADLIAFRLRPARAGGVTLSVGSVLRPAGMPSVGVSSLRLERLGCQARSLLSGAVFRVRMCCQAVGRIADFFVLKVAA